MRKHCILTIFIFLQFFCSAQKDTLHKRGVEPGTISINAGFGYSAIKWTEQVADFWPYGESGVSVIWMSPVYAVTTDYSISRRSGFGIGITYQSLFYIRETADPWEKRDSVIANRLNISAQYLYHLSQSPNKDAYIGIRSGISIWTLNDRYTMEPVNSIPQYFNITSRRNVPSIQLLFGYRAYVTKRLALQLEAGIGTPYFLEGGLAYRIFTQKK